MTLLTTFRSETRFTVKMSSSSILSMRHVALLTVTVVAACGDGGTEPLTPPPDPPRATTITVSPATALLAGGDTARLRADVLDQNGQVIAGARVTWRSSNLAVALVEWAGPVEATGVGMATITALAGNASGTAEITVEDVDRATLVAIYDATDGPNWGHNGNWLTDAPLGEWYGVRTHDRTGRVDGLNLGSNGLKGPIPPEVGNLAYLDQLSLGDNGLKGSIPPEVGNLAHLEGLFLHDNDLSGPIPQSFLQLGSLQVLSIRGNKDLCVPGTSAFLALLRGLYYPWVPDEESCNAVDKAILAALFDAAGGPAWTESGGWLGDGAVEEWHGVTADSLGRVTALDLSDNSLEGGWIPNRLGDLANLTSLNLSGNQSLHGAIPRALSNLDKLKEFHYYDTDLCVPVGPELRNWLNGIPNHRGTGLDCPQVSEADLARFLEDNPRIATAMLWFGQNNRLKPYVEWPQTLKEKLARAVGQLPGESGLPEVMTNQANDAEQTVLSKKDAEDLYVANIANSLHLEMLGTLPWSLDDLSDDELTLLLSSEGFYLGYDGYGSIGGGTGYVVAGRAMPAPPEVIHEFVGGAVGDSRYETLINVIDWARDHLYHFSVPPDDDNYEAEPDHWDYRGTPPVARMLTGGSCQRLRDIFAIQFSALSFPVSSTPSFPAFPSSTALTGSGGLIQTSSGSSAALGGPATKRSGRAA